MTTGGLGTPSEEIAVRRLSESSWVLGGSFGVRYSDS